MAQSQQGADALAFGDQLAVATAGLGALSGAIGSAVSQATRFAEAVAPSSVLVLNQAMYDFSAVIGTALTPVVYGAAEAVKSIGGVLLPVMRALQPVVAQVTGVFVSLVEQAAPALESLGEVVVILAGWFGNFIEIVSPLVTLVTVMQTVFFDLVKAMLEWVGSLFGGNAKDNVKGWMQQFAQGIILATAVVAKFVGSIFGIKGGGLIVDSLIKATDTKKKGEDITGLGVARDAKFQGFGDYGRDVAKAALLAGSGAGPQKTDNQWLADTHAALLEMKTGTAYTIQQLRDDMLDKLPDAIARAIRAGAAGAWDAGKQVAYQAAGLGSQLNAMLGLSGVERWVQRTIDGE